MISYQKGQKIGECIFIRDAPYYIDKGGQYRRMGVFLCKCGIEFICSISNIKSATKSCGCLQKTSIKKLIPKHGNSSKRLRKISGYGCWASMIERCTEDKSNHAYPYYGEKGVGVCDKWRKYENFLLDMGLRPSIKHTIDRYPNNDGNYEPGNCRWATKKEQANNRNSNRLIEYNGETKTFGEWCTTYGINYHSSYTRFFYEKKSMDEVIKRGVDNNNGVINYQTKISKEVALKIREAYSVKPELYTELAKQFNVPRKAVSNVINRKSWKHI